MKILLVYPRFADALWAYKHGLEFIGKRASSPPLGLLTVAAMLPKEWTKRLVDMNVTGLSDEDIQWADYVFLGAMLAQQASTEKVIARCKSLQTKVVAGGPLFSDTHQDFGDIDHIVIGEAEASLPSLLRDLEQGCAQRVYRAGEWPDVRETPPPLWSLADMKYYALMTVQFTRGCPYDCEFCNVVVLNGHHPRVKDKDQVVAELEALYQHGWRGHVFVCDDNFLGNRHKIKSEILLAIIKWMQANDYPFVLTAAVSVDLADDDKVMDLMIRAGFDRVTLGIESPDEESLAETNKLQNVGRDLLAAVRKIQNHGLEVQGGFIVGFDSDQTTVFDKQIDFIQESGIATAMVSLLFAFPGTRLYERLKQENRLLPTNIGENAYGAINFIPRMGREALISGHKHVLKTIYSPKYYYERVKTFLVAHNSRKRRGGRLELDHVKAFLKSTWLMGVKDVERRYYWMLLAFTLLNHPRSFPASVRLAVTGYHFRKDIEEYISKPNTEDFADRLPLQTECDQSTQGAVQSD
jgi:radical SAM superfamily enzyme YgiQ (UPF0313 family)